MTKVLHIEGMRCGGCAGRVEKALKALGCEVKVDLEARTAAVTAENVCECAMIKAVEELGFKVVEMK